MENNKNKGDFDKLNLEVIEMSETSETVFGYIRVSTKEQNETRQMIALKQQGAENIFIGSRERILTDLLIII